MTTSLERKSGRLGKAKDEPIIRSLLDIDFYKITMAQFAWGYRQLVPVGYGYKNRTTRIRVADVVPVEELREQLEHTRTLRSTGAEINFLRSLDGLFEGDFLEFLREVRLPEISVRVVDGQFDIETEGFWPEAIFWETIILSTVNELYYRNLLEKEGRTLQDLYPEGMRRLFEKIAKLRANPEVKFIEFGTRRRSSREWQEIVTFILSRLVPEQLLGTSNVHLARTLHLQPSGTCAHENDMVYAALAGDDDEMLRDSHKRMLEDWWDLYGERLAVALTDTFGSDFFFEDFTLEQARNWRGLRQDSGDPYEFGEREIAFYQNFGIDPKTKLLLPSDGLDVDLMIGLTNRFADRINVVHGWGTNLTNDLGLDPISHVVKAISANGVHTVKLSDNAAKATGDPKDVERYKRVFGYTRTASQETIY